MSAGLRHRARRWLWRNGWITLEYEGAAEWRWSWPRFRIVTARELELREEAAEHRGWLEGQGQRRSDEELRREGWAAGYRAALDDLRSQE